jgi:hypothetical protein
MRAYGLPRNQDVGSPDMGDIGEYALPGHRGHLPGKGGDIRSCHKNSSAKRATRRRFKRQARSNGRRIVRESLDS